MEQFTGVNNILVIDDDAVARMLAKRHLEIAGFSGNIITAENGQMGFDIISNSDEKFTIILDYHMPELDGLGLLYKMKSHNIQHPVFMLSSSLLKEHHNECLQFSMVQDYLIKPVDQQKVKQVIEFVQVNA